MCLHEVGDRLNPRRVVTDSTLYGADGTAPEAPTVCDHLFDPGRVFAQPPNKSSNTGAVPQQLSRALSVHATPHSMLHITDSRTLLSQTVKSWIDQRVVTDSTLLRKAQTATRAETNQSPCGGGDKLSLDTFRNAPNKTVCLRVRQSCTRAQQRHCFYCSGVTSAGGVCGAAAGKRRSGGVRGAASLAGAASAVEAAACCWRSAAGGASPDRAGDLDRLRRVATIMSRKPLRSVCKDPRSSRDSWPRANSPRIACSSWHGPQHSG